MPKESVELDIFGVTFDSRLTFENHLRSVSRAASQRLGILRKSWRIFHDRLVLERCFRGFVLPILEYLKLLNPIVNGACFFNWWRA